MGDEGQVGQRRILLPLVIRYFGYPPGKEAPELERLLWTRRLGLRMALPFVPVLAIAGFTINETWAWVALGVWAVVFLVSLGRLERDIARARREAP